MRMTRILSMIIALAMVLGTMTTTVFANSYEAKIGENNYETVETAVAAATKGDTITLLDNITVDEMLRVEGKSFTLDLNGHTITAGNLPESSNMVLYITTGDTVIIDDSVGGGGIVNNSVKGYAILNQGTLVVNGGTFVGDYALWNGYDNINSTATINGGTFNYNGVSVNGGYSVANNGTMIVNSGADINDWVHTFGSLTVEGGNIENVFVTEGVTVAERTTTITGGTIGELCDDESGINDISVMGGTFASDVSAYIADGCNLVENSDGTVSVVNNNEAKIGKTLYSTLADALAVGGEITLLKDVTSSSILKIEKDTVLDLNGFTVTGSAKKVFEVFEDATFKNGTIKNTYADKTGRCINTRTGGLTLNIENVSLETNSKAANTQVINIGGDATGMSDVVVNITDSTLTASKSGYGVLIYNPVDMTITDSNISGYAALYFKAADGSAGSKGSDVEIINSDLNSSYHRGEDFGTIVFEDTNINVTVDADSSITTEGNALCFSDNEENTTADNNVALNGTVSADKVLNGWKEGATVSSTNSNVVAALKNEGFAVNEGVVAGKITTTTDAGYYMSAEARLGLMRYLFHFGIDGTISDAGVKFIKGSDLSAQIQAGEIATSEEKSNTFFADINEVPETATGRYYAMGYVVIDGEEYWSNPIFCEPNFTRHFSSLDDNGGVE